LSTNRVSRNIINRDSFGSKYVTIPADNGARLAEGQNTGQSEVPDANADIARKSWAQSRPKGTGASKWQGLQSELLRSTGKMCRTAKTNQNEGLRAFQSVRFSACNNNNNNYYYYINIFEASQRGEQ
jgi:hypothetical protein